MLSVLALFVLGWACLIVAICAVCAMGGIADEQTEEWYREHTRLGKEPDEQHRGAA
jgi:hypothetical protein